MKILITGASGFIGKNLIPALISMDGMEITALSRHKVGLAGIRFVEGDVLQKDLLEKVFQDMEYDIVVHLAAITEHSAIVDNKMETFQINLLGTMNLLECFNKYCTGGLFLYASTGKVYGQAESPISEGTSPNPQNILGKTKRITEQVIDFYSIPQNQYLMCRIFNIYGEFQRRSFVVPTIIDQLSQPEVTLGNLSDQRDYLYIDDLVRALTACITRREHFAQVDYVNIGSGRPASVADILDEIESLTGRAFAIKTAQERMRRDEAPVEYCSNQKISALTGWYPAFSLREGLKKTLQSEGVLC